MTEIPASFPRDPWPVAISGAQSKLAARLIDGRYIVGITNAELVERYEMCEDLVQQLLVYCKRKQEEHPEWSREVLLQKVEKSARAKGWDISPIEITWLIARLRESL